MITGPVVIESPAAAGVSAGVILPAGPQGESAYDVAVSNGYVGTEAAWLASLIGPPADARALNAATAAAGSAAVSALASQMVAATSATSAGASAAAAATNKAATESNAAAKAADRTAVHWDHLAADTSASNAHTSETNASASAAAAATSAAAASGGGPVPSGGFTDGHFMIANNNTGTSYTDGGAHGRRPRRTPATPSRT